MTFTLPQEHVLRIQQLTREGAFETEEEALTEALDLLEREVEMLQIRARIDASRAQVAAGNSTLVTPEWLAERAEGATSRYLARKAESSRSA